MYIGLDVHKKLSYYSMVDGEGTEVKKVDFQQHAKVWTNLRMSCLKAQKWRSKRRLRVFLRMNIWMKGE